MLSAVHADAFVPFMPNVIRLNVVIMSVAAPIVQEMRYTW
jgi:hypothetical protein